MSRPLASAVSRLTFAVVATVLAYGTSAFANTAANTTIKNQASVSYNDAGGIAQTAVTAQASVTVTLTQAAPTLSTPADVTVSQGQSTDLTYTITANANGPDTYALTDSVTDNNISGTGITPTLSATTVTLGATTLAVATVGNDTSVTVPYDNDATGTSKINEIAVNDWILIGSNLLQVGSITKNSTANTATISFANGGKITSVLAVGTLVAEQQTFKITVPSGNVTTGSSGTRKLTATATASGSGPAASSGQTTVTVNAAQLVVTKEVSTDGSAFTTTVSAKSGATLFYRITVKNSGSTAAKAVKISDVIPSYLTYVAASGQLSTDATATYGAAGNTTLSDSGPDYGYDGATTTVSYVSTASPDLAPSGTWVLFFKAKIN